MQQLIITSYRGYNHLIYHLFIVICKTVFNYIITPFQKRNIDVAGISQPLIQPIGYICMMDSLRIISLKNEDFAKLQDLLAGKFWC